LSVADRAEWQVFFDFADPPGRAESPDGFPAAMEARRRQLAANEFWDNLCYN
jgi:hypothetical protein